MRASTSLPAPAPATCRRRFPARARAGEVLPPSRWSRRAPRHRSPSWSDFRQPKIQNLGVSALGHEDVRRLDVAVNDALGVRGVERVGNLDGQRQNSVSSGRPAIRCFSVTPSRNSMAMKALPILLTDVVDRADVGMIQGGSGRASRRKRSKSLRILGNIFG